MVSPSLLQGKSGEPRVTLGRQRGGGSGRDERGGHGGGRGRGWRAGARGSRVRGAGAQPAAHAALRASRHVQALRQAERTAPEESVPITLIE